MMKKTMVMLLALGSTVLADTYEKIAPEGADGGNYTILLNLEKLGYDNHTSCSLLQLADNAALYCQIGRYLGVSQGGKTEAGMKMPEAYKAKTYGATAGQTRGWFLDSGDSNGLAGTLVLIDGDAAANTTTFTFTRAGKDDVSLTFDSYLDCGRFAINTTRVKAYKTRNIVRPKAHAGMMVAVHVLGSLILLGLGAVGGFFFRGRKA